MENQKFLEKIDKYNKLRLLYNIFQFFLIKSKDTNDEQLKKILTSYKSNESRFIINNQKEEENFRIFFSDINQIKKMNKDSTLNEQESLKLLSYFEEEIRNFFKNHNFKIDINNKNEERKNQNNLINAKINQILILLTENTKILEEIFNKFKNAHLKEKQNFLDNINQQYSKINNILQTIILYIYSTFNSEQNIKSLNQLKDNLIQEQINSKNEIKVIKQKIRNFTDQGEEMSKLLAEYKRLNNMIDCINLEKKNNK